jgi:hypothetical protein
MAQRLGARLQDQEERPSRDVVAARSRFWAELREGQREADARLPTRRG